MSGAGARFAASDIVSAVAVALIAELAFVGMMQSPERPALQADISDEKAQPIAVSITPVPLLKLGGKNPVKLPASWQRQPKPIAKKEDAPLPSPQAKQTPDAIPSAPVPDAAVAPEVADAAPPASSAPVDPAAVATDASAASAASGPGDPNGSPNGTETDPLKARAVDRYRMQLAAFLKERFNIRGKIPFSELKLLHAAVSVTVGEGRTVASFTITHPSGNATFDAEVRDAVQGRVGAILPAPPPLYPDILGTTIPVGFSCTIESQCE